MCIRRRWFTLRIGLLVTLLLVASATIARAQAPFETLHYFDNGEEPATTSIMQASDGDFYITAARGGNAGVGVIFKMTPAGVVTPLHSFEGGTTDGANPYGSLLEAVDGNFYGTTARGGSANFGTVFRMTPDGSLTLLHSFVAGAADGAHPKGGLIQATDGKFYGTTYGGGAADTGTIFSMTTTGAVALLYVFPGDGLAQPHTGLFQATDGFFYVMLPQGGFRLSASGVRTGIGVPGTSNFQPAGPVFQTPDGILFARGFEPFSGDPTARRGLVVKITLGSFPSNELWRIGQPGVVTALLRSSDGAFYGLAASVDASTSSRLFKIASFPAPTSVPNSLTSTTLYEFDPDAGRPDSLIQASDGNFYGTIAPAGSNDVAMVFRATAAGIVDELHTFTVAPTEGAAAAATALVQGSDGQFYVTTATDGAAGAGTVFRLTAGGESTLLHAFAGGIADGANPTTLLQGRDGLFYGTTTAGGANGKGTVFRVSATGATTILHSFDSATTGEDPAVLIQAADGQFYGGTLAGGSGFGTVFRMSADGSMTVLRTFSGTDGVGPNALIEGPDGNFYGTSTLHCTARVFRMAPDGSVTTLTTVTLGILGPCGAPIPGIFLNRDRNLYWTIERKFYRMTLQGVVTIVREFPPSPAPSLRSVLIQGSDGSFYGAALVPLDGSLRDGIVRVTTGGIITVLRAFRTSEGTPPPIGRLSTLLQAADGNVYGISGPVRISFLGTVFYYSSTAFRLFPPVPPAEVTVAPTGTGQVRLSWAGAAGAIRYRVTRRNSAGVESVLGEVTATSFLDTTAVRGQRYSYTVTTITSYGDSNASYVVAITAGRAIASDFDGDGLVDIAVFRPSNGTWYLTRSNNGRPLGVVWGNGADVPVPADYDGDGKTDVAVFRPSIGAWYVMPSTTAVPYGVVWGNGADTPVPADYDGDNKADLAVFRPSTGVWYVLNSSTGTPSGVAWGNGADIPVPGDYDGDGKADLAVFRASDGIWYVLNSSTGTPTGFAWGNGQDRPVAADYDGDGKTDLAVFRPSTGTWYVLNSSSGTPTGFVWGNGADILVPGDYDGDGKADVAVFRPSNGAWYVRNSRTGALTGMAWGNAADVPILKR